MIVPCTHSLTQAGSIGKWNRAANSLEEVVHLPAGAKRLNQDQLENTFREMGQFSHKIPSLPDEAFTRESLYQDHD